VPQKRSRPSPVDAAPSPANEPPRFESTRRLPGYRLKVLELLNWGTFDSGQGSVHRIEPSGSSALLVGRNGSGKSTLIDAILTLLVRPVVRNYNVAAGASKMERSERTYLCGAYGRISRDDQQRADVNYLRPHGSTLSMLLAQFHNHDLQRSFTIAQVLYQAADQRIEKMYLFAEGERTIVEHLGGIHTAERLKQQLVSRGWQVAQSHQEYHQWITRHCHMQSKAMDLFNQTVAVKDIHSLNQFLREHMLERKDWGQRVDNLLLHFQQLSDAYRNLQRARRQFELLQPIESFSKRFVTQQRLVDQLRRSQEAIVPFFRLQILEVITPQRDQWKRQQKVELDEIAACEQQLTHYGQQKYELQQAIQQAGDQRLQVIPWLIDKERSAMETKQSAHRWLQSALQTLQSPMPMVTTSNDLVSALQWTAQATEQLQTRAAAIADEMMKVRILRQEQSQRLVEEEDERQRLHERPNNLPQGLIELRRQLCAELRVDEADLPFAAELMKVKDHERQWEASIEHVLRPLALSLLVPEVHYRAVSAYVDRTRLRDQANRGQWLVYLKINPSPNKASPNKASPSQRPLHHASLLHKLDLRTNHVLADWLRSELEDRFDYRCCDSIEAFHQTGDMAITVHRHVKQRGTRHAKDDREAASDPRRFVLGWDNQPKRTLLSDRRDERAEQLRQLDASIAKLQSQSSENAGQLDAAREVLRHDSFDRIDFFRHQREIDALSLERQRLESSDDKAKALRQRLAEIEGVERALKHRCDALKQHQGEIRRDLDQADKLIRRGEEIIASYREEGRLASLEVCFESIQARLVGKPTSFEQVHAEEDRIRAALQLELDRNQSLLDPLRSELLGSMTAYLRQFSEESDDLQASTQCVDSFLGRLNAVRHDDLPRYEQRFKERLNEKVTQELGILHGELVNDRDEIQGRIEQLNQSLRTVEYRRGTFMRLEPRVTREAEIVAFQKQLRECLASSFDGRAEMDESRYQRIEKLIERLRNEERWRDKVTDVRRWFEFAAREVELETGQERGYYEDSTGQSGGEKAKLAFTILIAAIAYQYDIQVEQPRSDRFHFVVVDEMFSKVDDQYSEYALDLFDRFGLQLLVVAPLDAKARVVEPYVGHYFHVVKDEATHCSEVFGLTAREFTEQLQPNPSPTIRRPR
jgi:uncharacterized protein YPO0396